ncbi:hypothetical protein [Pseudomonas fluorescens]|uniref:Lipoprotein n=1 Tax=Pseudomonas fluorescens TaxID=294 RepID=A0A944DIB9_PSEFL|nr:hypothetical protein [Pseudomonas fluorescens]MBT2297571.1 hypothetical protein [Pseudomonas fluorescens]MBT2305769.1 hypothetical protein [Pseudomonas fluorescens]MBT2314208.1 hypothetical protein [Pseudomonas fluorescens]MBT2319300.1 hypothetical protein [Pseudomonas fluorescens]MBT2327510.1 hypothetical protein [Pseudomonas fluorescens]
MNPQSSHRSLAIVLFGALWLLSACNTQLEPVSYSPDYQAFSHVDGRVEWAPVACFEPSAEDAFHTDEHTYLRLLPPGCANNLTLLQMVEQRSDLIEGRAIGPTMAAPVGRAAQVYIEGYDREELHRRLAEQQARADKQEGQ